MKKNIINILLIFGLFFVLVTGVKAYDKAKAPTSIPPIDAELYASRADDADVFDFSNISFGDATGTSDMYKIKISTGIEDSGSFNMKLSDAWFSAYCLDPNVKYPIYGIARRLNNKITKDSITEMPNEKATFDFAVKAALFNSIESDEMYNLFKKLNNYDNDGELLYDYPTNYSSSSTPYKDMLQAIRNGEEVKVAFKSFKRNDGSGSVTLTGSEINEVLGLTGENYELTLTREKIFFDRYRTTNMGTTVNYNHVLWIIEHSYPTLSLAQLYEDAGVDVTNLNSELLALGGNTNLTDEEKIDGYIYSTIQYAIWNVLGTKVNDKTIGNTLTGSKELNKIYQYLIKDRSIYSTYGTTTFGSSITASVPSGSAIAEETSTNIKYGPYTVKSDMITAGTINLSLNDSTYARIIDKDGNEISSVSVNEKFYVLVDKTIKISSLVVTATASDGYTFEPTSNRGKIYYAYSPVIQNVISGGIIKKVTANTTIDLLINVKTGLPNIALLFFITLVIFSIGYILIIKINKPMKLND